MEEIFKTISDYPDYSISNNGRVYSIRYNRLLKTHIARFYLSVTLNKDKKRKQFIVHRLVAQEFIPNPENKPCVNHKDCNKVNNNVENLEWVTYKENRLHAIKSGLIYYVKGEKSNKSRLTENDILEIRRKYISTKFKIRRLSEEYGVSESNIRKIINRKIWNHI